MVSFHLLQVPCPLLRLAFAIGLGFLLRSKCVSQIFYSSGSPAARSVVPLSLSFPFLLFLFIQFLLFSRCLRDSWELLHYQATFNDCPWSSPWSGLRRWGSLARPRPTPGLVRTRSAWQSGGLGCRTPGAARVQLLLQFLGSTAFERKPVSFFLQKETPPRERDSVDSSLRVSAQVSRDTLPGPKMAGMTAASFLELPGEARAEKIWLPCRVDRRVPGTSVGTDCTVVTADAHSLWRRR